MTNIFKAVIFDFNGLIVDDEAIHCKCFQQVLGVEGIALTDADYWDKYLGFDDRDLIEAVFKRDGKKIPPKKLKTLVDKKASLYLPVIKTKLKFFPGVIEFVARVQKKYLLAIVSGANKPEIDFVLKEGKINKAFAEIVGAEETKHGKPDPEGFLIALARLKKINPDVRPGTCLVLEDSHAGIEAAKRCGMVVVALTHTYAADELKEADYVFKSFAEIDEWFDKLTMSG